MQMNPKVVHRSQTECPDPRTKNNWAKINNYML